MTMTKVFGVSRLLTAGAVACLFAGGPVARADSFSDLATAGAGPSNYAVLGLGGGQVNLSLVTVNGNVGIGAGGTIVNMAPSVINGNVFESTAGQYSGPGTLTGTQTISASLLAANVAGAFTAASDAASAVAVPAQTFSFSSITAATTITGGPGLNVVNITGNISLNNANLTLSGPSNAFFIINVGGNLSLVGTASLLTSVVPVSNILYNFTDLSGDTITTNIGDRVNGILLDAHSGSSMTLDGSFNGELIGNNITLMSGAVVNQPSPTPEPSSLALLATGLFGLVGFARRRFNL
jgi:hypothetical protein